MAIRSPGFTCAIGLWFELPACDFAPWFRFFTAAIILNLRFVLTGEQLSAKLRENRQVATWLDRTTGALLIGLAARRAYLEK
jgi:threonine/homoserine/homoserine lactone efflux protein